MSGLNGSVRSIVENLDQSHFDLTQRFHTMLDVSYPDDPVSQTLVIEMLAVAHASRMGNKRDAKYVLDRMHDHAVAILKWIGS